MFFSHWKPHSTSVWYGYHIRFHFVSRQCLVRCSEGFQIDNCPIWGFLQKMGKFVRLSICDPDEHLKDILREFNLFMNSIPNAAGKQCPTWIFFFFFLIDRGTKKGKIQWFFKWNFTTPWQMPGDLKLYFLMFPSSIYHIFSKTNSFYKN